MMKKEAYELNDAMMELVNGGDYGDSDKDNDPSNSRYHVGDRVEVYACDIHFWTETAYITGITWSPWYECWMYDVEYPDQSYTTVFASDIQSS